jgi:carboxypeptidase C (cathepsin A)
MNRNDRTHAPWWAAAAALMAMVQVSLPLAAQAPAEGAPPAQRFEATGELRIDDDRIHYRALVEESFLVDDGGQPTASLVSTSYLRTDTAKGTERPVLFVFNGGPGSAGLWLQMGLVGPRRVDFDDPVNPPTVPPYRLTDNAESLLDVADVVIFDPPGTGFSRVLEAGKPEDFFGVQQDAGVTVRFVRDWIRRHGRWNAPRFLMGESYGTIRAAVVAKLLAGGPFGSGSMDGLTLNGVILLGQAMDRNASGFGPANDLPSFAATAWYHGAVDNAGVSLEAHVAAAQAFAGSEYVEALFAGHRLAAEQRTRVAERIAELIGLPADLVLEHDLRVSADTFSKHLLSADGRQVGKYDARFALPLAASGKDPVADDPAMGQYVPAFVAALNLHLRDELAVSLDRPYLAIEFRKVNARWDYGSGPGVFSPSSHASDLAVAMRRNPALQLFVGTGWYDLVTTVGDAEYTVAHNDFPPERVTMKTYESGHMPYLGDESRRRLSADLRVFIMAASQP